MALEWFNLEELSRQLGRDRREIEKLVQRGRIPGRKISGDWQFHPTEITHWLEQEMREYTDRELALVEQTHRSTEVNAQTPVSSLLRPETVQVPLEAKTKRSVLESLIEVAGRSWQIWQPAVILQAVQERESVLPTAFEHGIALPHPRNPLPDAIGQSVLAFGLVPGGIPFGAPDRELTDLFFLVLCRDSRTHLQVLARLGRLLQSPGFTQKLRESPDSEAAYLTICSADQQLIE